MAEHQQQLVVILLATIRASSQAGKLLYFGGDNNNILYYTQVQNVINDNSGTNNTYTTSNTGVFCCKCSLDFCINSS